MKKLLFIGVFLIYGCKSEVHSISNIEIMSYVYEINGNEPLKAKSFLYAEINNDRKHYGSNNSIGLKNQKMFSAKISPDILNEVAKVSTDKTDADFLKKKDSLILDLYCGPIIRYRITYQDGNQLNLIIWDKEYDSSSVYFPFSKLYKILLVDIEQSDVAQNKLDYINQKEQQFLQFARKKDSINLEFPPPPNKSTKIIFVK